MSSLFQSPSKQANAAASAQQGLSDAEIAKLEGYVAQQQGQERTAIAGLGDNPYLGAAAQMSPSAYRVDPTNTQTYGQTPTAGNTQGASATQTSGIPPAQSNPFMPQQKAKAFSQPAPTTQTPATGATTPTTTAPAPVQANPFTPPPGQNGNTWPGSDR